MPSKKQKAYSLSQVELYIKDMRQIADYLETHLKILGVIKTK